MVKLVDVHCHLDFEDFDKDREDLVQKLKEQNIFALTNTTSYQNYEKTKNLFKNCDCVKVCPGLYPQEAEKINEEEFKDYLKLIESEKENVIAIGEVGLDKHHTKDNDLFEIQVKRFKELIEFAIKIDKPMLIHTRKAEKEVLDILREYIEKTGFRKFDLHCFTGKKKFIKDIKDLNIYCSIPLVVLNTESFQILTEGLPINQLLVETDSPFLNPAKVRNSPLEIPKIYEKIAEIKGLDKKEVENIIYNNYMKFTM